MLVSCYDETEDKVIALAMELGKTDAPFKQEGVGQLRVNVVGLAMKWCEQPMKDCMYIMHSKKGSPELVIRVHGAVAVGGAPMLYATFFDVGLHGTPSPGDAHQEEIYNFMTEGEIRDTATTVEINSKGIALARYLLRTSAAVPRRLLPRQQPFAGSKFLRPGLLPFLYPVTRFPPFAAMGDEFDPSAQMITEEQETAIMKRKVTMDPLPWQYVRALVGMRKLMQSPLAAMVGAQSLRLGYVKEKGFFFNRMRELPKVMQPYVQAAAEAAGVWDGGRAMPREWGASIGPGSEVSWSDTRPVAAVEPHGRQEAKRSSLRMQPDGSVTVTKSSEKVALTALDPETGEMVEARACSWELCSALIPETACAMCGGCKRVWYCGVEHQRDDWRAGHRAQCKLWQREAQAAEALKGS